jgi:hypothetical protein
MRPKLYSVLPLPVDFDHEIMENEKSNFVHEKINLVEKNVGTPGILGRTLVVHLGYISRTFFHFRDLTYFKRDRWCSKIT